MLNSMIADIDIKISQPDFEQKLQDHVNNWSESMTTDVKQMRTRMGYSMYKIEIGNAAGSSIMEIVAEQNSSNGDMWFHPFQLKNMNDSFYKMSIDPNDTGDLNPWRCMIAFFSHLTADTKGKFAYVDAETGKVGVIINGKDKKCAIAVVDGDGNVYSSINAKTIKSLSDGPGFTVNKPINEWIGENLDVQQAISQLASIDEKMNFIGKYLISKKSKDEIESDEFMDIFCQAGIIGFTDKTCLMVYKLIM